MRAKALSAWGLVRSLIGSTVRSTARPHCFAPAHPALPPTSESLLFVLVLILSDDLPYDKSASYWILPVIHADTRGKTQHQLPDVTSTSYACLIVGDVCSPLIKHTSHVFDRQEAQHGSWALELHCNSNTAVPQHHASIPMLGFSPTKTL